MDKTSTNKMRIALVGLGQIARHHIAGIQAAENLELVAVCDTDPSKQQEDWVKQLHVRTYSDIDTLLKEEADVAYIVVATSTDSHKPLIKRIVEAGRTPIVEKPIVAANDTIDDLDLDKVVVMYHWQYAAETLALKEMLKGEKIQRIHITIEDPYLRHKKIAPKHLSKGDAWTDSGVNALSYIGALLNEKDCEHRNDILSKATDIHLEHLKYAGYDTNDQRAAVNRPVDSICRFRINDTQVSIHVHWGRKERKISYITTAQHRYRVNHARQTIFRYGAWPKITHCGDRNNRLSEHYINYYRSADWNMPNGKQIRSTHHIHHLYAQSFWHTLRAHHNNKRKKRVREIENWVPLTAAIAGLALFFGYIYFSPWEIHMPAWLGTANHGFRMMDFLVNALAALAGVIATYYLYNRMQRYRNRYEDDIKVEYNDHVLFEQYGTEYWKDGLLNGTHFGVYYDPLFGPGEADKVEIQDSAAIEDKFALDNFIRFQYFSIRSAHASDSFKNEPTIRLRDVTRENGKVILHTHRANYLAHMLTNRAIDYKINNMASLRQLFEYEDHLTPLNKSLFANHIGVNALILIDHGKYLLLPQRSNNATISKNMMTASVATRLKTNDYRKPLDKNAAATIPDDTVLNAMAINPREWEKLKEEKRAAGTNLTISTRLIGGGRDIYEGGKPTLFYLVEIEDLTREEYLSLEYTFKKHFDEIKRIFLIETSQLYTRNNRICFEQADIKNAKSWKELPSRSHKSRTIKPEKNLLSLLWLWQEITPAIRTIQ